jgi:Na+/phosphate symporter
MSTVNNITKALNGQKLELSSQVVELGIADDILKEISNANIEIKNYLSSVVSIQSLSTKAIESGNEYIKYAINLDKMLDTLKIKATELGIKVDGVKGYKEATDLLVRYDPSAVQSKVADLKKLK